MGVQLRKGSHTVSHITCHIVWVTKYRYKVLIGDSKALQRNTDSNL